MKAHLTTHAIFDTIPLRIGVVLSDRKVFLENLVYDEVGTDQQNRRELADNRYHVIANLVTLYPTRKDLGRWRLVVKDSQDSQKLPPVFTVLPTESDKIMWEEAPLESLTKAGQLTAFKHFGFWKCMDALRDKIELEELWRSNKATPSSPTP